MRSATRITLFMAALAGLPFLSRPAAAISQRGFGLGVLVDGSERPEYDARGNVYVEAVRGREYTLRITNPLPYRVGVALSVDGLNTIDAKHTDPWTASKWILEPYQSIEISGWQVNDSTARKFYFTGERQSYGAALGQTQNLGVIEAVFFREKPIPPPPPVYRQSKDDRDGRYDSPSAAEPAPQGSASGMGGPNERKEKSAARAEAPRAAQPALADEYAATGMGGRTGHDVTRVNLELERRPMAQLRVRYEFHPQLVKLGVFPSSPTPLERREGASGFGSWCPEPGR